MEPTRNTGQGEGHSRRRAEISRGKRAVQLDSEFVQPDSDFEIDDRMEDVEPPMATREEEADDSITAEELNVLRILLDMKGAGTRYPDRYAMERLGIAADVDELLNNIGIGALMYRRNDSYRKASCLFLATLQLHLCPPGQVTQDGTDSYISFWANGGRRNLSFREIDQAHFLPPSNRHGLGVDRDEAKAVWRIIASGEYHTYEAKAT